MSVPFLDLSRQHQPLRAAMEAAVGTVLESHRFILGPEVEALEKQVAALCGVAHGVGVASGTDALILALQALGVGPGDEVVTSAFSFFATASSIARLGATPVFADIEPAGFTMDARAVATLRAPKVRALMPVHIFGQCADMESLVDGARVLARREVPMVEDAAQAIGATRHGRPAGSLGAAGCLSFYPTKNLGGAGDGGMVTTDDPSIAARVRSLRAHGDAGRYDHRELGLNSRLDSLQAAVLLVKLKHLAAWNEERRALARRYDDLLADLSGDITLPITLPGNQHTWHQYVIRAPRRDDLQAHLTSQGIGSAVYYPIPLHRQRCFEQLGYHEGDLPETERACREVLALPIYPGLRSDEQEQVAASIGAFHKGG